MQLWHGLINWFCTILCVSSFVQAAVKVDLSSFRSSPDFQAVQDGGTLSVHWSGENKAYHRLRFNLLNPDKLIAELSHASTPTGTRNVILQDVAPAFWAYIGRRHGSWEDNYFDRPSSRPHEITEHFSKLVIEGCRVESDGNQLRIVIPGLWMGFFHGDLVFTLYAGSNLVKQEAVVSTQEPNIAYYYDAWLTGCSTNQLNRLLWLDTEGKFQRHVLTSDIDLQGVFLQVHRRMLVAEGKAGSLAVFPPPHQYFFARDETVNYKNLWYRLYRINSKMELGDFFSLGIRQTPLAEQANKVPLINAPPGTEQRLSMFWYLGTGDAARTFERVSAYTNDDRFVPVPGYKTFTSHYHVSATMDWRRKDRPKQNYAPEFVQVFRNMGVNIVHLMDFHTDGHARDLGQIRLNELRDYFDLCQMLSNTDFLLLPGEELWVHYGGHWSLMFPRPVYWYLDRREGQPFLDNTGSAGKAYRVGSTEEMLKMIQLEEGLAWQAHPRTKGSVGYPDKEKDTAHFKDDTWLGSTFKAMPSDHSSPRLGERALNLLDDMNNWGHRKFMLGEVDVFKIDHTHELYAHMNINYLKLPRTPSFPDWSEVVTALKSGDFFTTTGEVLIHDFQVNGVGAGGSAAANQGGEVLVEAEFQWTFPLNFYEVVWGDGGNTHRRLVSLSDTKQFGRQRFQLREQLPGVRWARVAVWDVAANGAMTQPVRFSAN